MLLVWLYVVMHVPSVALSSLRCHAVTARKWYNRSMEQDEVKAMNGILELARNVDIHDKEAIAKLDEMITEAIAVELVTREIKLLVMLILTERHIEDREL